MAATSPFHNDVSTKFAPQALVVWGTWFVMLVGLFAYVVRYGHNIPFYDEWVMVRVLDGTQPIDVEWLWAQHNDHRIPIPKLILSALLKVSGWDFRVGMYFNVLVLAALASALIRVCSEIRGRIHYADAFFPLILMSWGHYEHLLWTWQVTQVSAVALVICLLLAMVRFGTRLDTPAQAVVAGIGVVGLPLFGVPGLAYAPGFVIWLIISGAQGWRTGAPAARSAAVVLWGCAAGTAALVVLYFVGFELTAQVGAESSVSEPFALLRAAATAIAFTAQGLGPAAPEFRTLSYLIVLAICLASAAVLVLAMRDRDPAVRSRAWAIAFFIVAFGGLAASVAIARPGLTFPPRYFLMATPILCAIYFIWVMFPPPRLAGFAQAGLAMLAVAALGANYGEGLGYGGWRDGRTRAFVADLRQGVPPSELITRHQWAVMPHPHPAGGYYHDALAHGFRVLRERGIGVFKDLARNGPSPNSDCLRRRR